MAICGGCGAETRRVRTTFHEDSSHRVIGTTDECDKCHPAMFEPRWKTERGAAAFEAYPTKYKKFTLPDGRTGYRATEEWTADTVAKLSEPPVAKAELEAAYAKKRQNARREPLTQAETTALLNKWRPAMEARAEMQRSQKEQAKHAWLMP
jgi:hypothetical protein